MSNTNPSLDEIWSDMYRTPAQQSSMVSEAKDYQVPSKKSRGKKKRSKLSDKDIGAIEQVNSSYEVDNLFNSILREMEEQGDFETSDDLFDGGDDNVFDGDDDFGGDDMISISELKNMTLQEIMDLISGDDVDDLGDDEFDVGGDDEFDFDSELDEDDEIPAESYGFSGGESNPKGAQGNYDGRARKQAKSTHVKDNGDAKVGQTQDTGYDPDDVEGREGAEHGAQGNYDGRARAQGRTDLVKPNGDADFSKVKTNKRTSSGKKDKNFF